MFQNHARCAPKAAMMFASAIVLGGNAWSAGEFAAIRQATDPDRLDRFHISNPAASTIIASTAGNFVRGVQMTGPADGYYVCTDNIGASPVGFFAMTNGVSTLLGPLPFESGTDGGLCFNADKSALYWLADPPSQAGIDPDDTLFRIDFDGTVTQLGGITVSGVSPLAIIGIAIHPTTGVLYGLESTSDSLITIDPVMLTGTKVGTGLGITVPLVGDMDFDADGTLYIIINTSGNIHSVDLTTGLAGPLVGSFGVNCSALSLIPAPDCPADINNDGQVNVTDLLAVIGAWGACPAPPASCTADINTDGQVNVTDLLAVIGAWGSCR